MFLQHPKVPETIKGSQSSVMNLQNLISRNPGSSAGTQGKHFYYASGNLTDLAEHFRALDSFSVIHLENLEFLHLTLDGAYEDLLNSTITEMNYRPPK